MTQETKQIFSLRKFKTGTHSALLAKYGIVLATTAVLMGAGAVSADEVTTSQTKPTTEVVAPAAGQASVSAETSAKKQSAVTSDIPTSVPVHTTQDQAVTAVEDAQATLKDNVSTAKDTGVVVKEGDTKEVVINSGNAAEKTSEILTDLNQQDKAVKEATEKQKVNQKAYEEATKEHSSVVKKGQENLSNSAKELDKVVAEAKKSGVNVKETTTTTKPKYKEVKGLEGEELRKADAENLGLYTKAVSVGVAEQDKSKADLKRTLDTYNADKKAYSDSKTERDLAVSKGQSEIQKSTKAVEDTVALAKKNELAITETTTNSTPKFKDIKGLKGEELRKAVAENVKLYNEAVKNATANMNTSSSEASKKINEYLTADANYKKGLATNTGLKWQNGVTLSGSDGAEKQTGNEDVIDEGDHTLRLAGTYATQSTALNQNTDANFDNIFKINGSGTIHVKNTTNGDVDITFSEINSPYSTGTYVAVWGDDNGGIAWSVFSLYSGGASSAGGGEAGSGGSGTGIYGRILNYVYSYKATVKTSNDVSVVTFNDIDNTQAITMNGLDGAKVETGKNIQSSGNVYSAGSGDVSQGSSGILDSNGVRWTFEKAKKQDFTFVHTVEGNNASIVGGIFGAASEVAKAPEKPVLSVKKETVDVPEAPTAPTPPTVTVKKVNVTVPEAPEAPKPVEVEVQYYKLTTTPTPETPKPVEPKKVLPSTGEAGSVLSIIGGVLLSGLALVGVRKRKED
ncbi:TPA: LPXTG cell wall anchor domain-containing protein [Streptococcus agalactiae]